MAETVLKPSRRQKRGKRKGGHRATTDALRGLLVVTLKDGSQRYRVSIPGGRRGVKVWSPVVETLEQAVELRRRVLDKLETLPPMTLTFEQALEATRADYARRCRPATLQWFDFQVPALRAFFGTMMVSAIKPQDVERFAAQQIATGVSPGTVHHRRRGLRAVLSHAADQLVNGDPLAKARRGTWPKLRKAKVTAPEPATIHEFLRKTKDRAGRVVERLLDEVAFVLVHAAEQGPDAFRLVLRAQATGQVVEGRLVLGEDDETFVGAPGLAIAQQLVDERSERVETGIAGWILLGQVRFVGVEGQPGDCAVESEDLLAQFACHALQPRADDGRRGGLARLRFAVVIGPIGLWGDVFGVGNGYQYAGNSPAFLVDPLGLQIGPFNVPRTNVHVVTSTPSGPGVFQTTTTFATPISSSNGPDVTGYKQDIEVGPDFTSYEEPTPLFEQVMDVVADAISDAFEAIDQDIALTFAGLGIAKFIGRVVGHFRVSRLTVPSDKLRHMFGNPAHNLGEVLGRFRGDAGAAGNAILRAAQDAAKRCGATDYFEVYVWIRNSRVTVTGKMVNGIARIGTAFVK